MDKQAPAKRRRRRKPRRGIEARFMRLFAKLDGTERAELIRQLQSLQQG